jgi:hypothetical protein
MMARRAQLQALEPIFIVIILAIVMGIGLLFYVRIADSQERQDSSAQAQQEDLATLARISRMPELSCSADASLTNCIDVHKAEAFSRLLANDQAKLYYYPYLGDKNITITWLDLASGVTTTLRLYGGMQSDTYTATTTYFTVYESVNSTAKLATLTILRRSG